MVRSINTCCDPQLKTWIKEKHWNCYKGKPAKYILRRKLNAFYNIDLQEDIPFKVCHNIYNNVKNYKVPRSRRRWRRQEKEP